MSLLYKTLFEVKLTHEFYVTRKDGKTVFSLSNQKDRIDFLLDQYATNRPAINGVLQFEFPSDLEEIYSNYCLKLLPTYSGFKVAIRVHQKLLADNTLVYEPLANLPADFCIYVRLKKISGDIENYTHSGINHPVPSSYFFSNENIPDAKIFPFLTNAVSLFDPGRAYSQGDLAAYGLNDIRQYYKDDTGDQWENVAGNAFTNENDRLLVPLRFYYSFITSTNPTNAVFELKNTSGNTVKTISLKNQMGLQKLPLDFSDVSGAVMQSGSSLLTDVVFLLEVSADNGYSASHRLLFNDALHSKEDWGLVGIKTKAINASFNLLATDGFLIRRQISPGTWIDAPVFEIPIKSRFPYWRFVNNKGKDLKLIPVLADYLNKEDKVLLSKRPRSVSASYFLLQKQGSADTVYVPNPLNYDLQKDSKDRLCYDIMVAESDLFPVIP